jgi:hypothetical protein
MTAARQQRKRYRACRATIAGLLLALSTGLSVTCAATTERIVVDWHTGLAIGGYDPVAFFTDGKPVAGRPDFELHYGGAVWRFCNVGNKEAFAARPDVYVPQFGGYDPVGVARGVAVAGNPEHWLISGERCSSSTIRLGAKDFLPTRSAQSLRPNANGRRCRVPLIS